MASNDRLIMALGATAEAMGQKATPTALVLMADDLSEFSEHEISLALKSMRRKNMRFCVASILEHIQSNDGHPTADRAWSLFPKTEDDTAVVTSEMFAAWRVACDQYDNGDEVGAQISFKREYKSIIEQAREGGVKAVWQITLGHDPKGRSQPLITAVIDGRLTSSAAENSLLGNDEGLRDLAVATKDQRLLETYAAQRLGVDLGDKLVEIVKESTSREDTERRVAELRAIIAGR